MIYVQRTGTGKDESGWEPPVMLLIVMPGFGYDVGSAAARIAGRGVGNIDEIKRADGVLFVVSRSLGPLDFLYFG